MTVPVPLTDIERRTFWPIGKGQFHYVTLRQPERDALCEALRIAVGIASEAVGRLGKIGNTYSTVYAGDISEGEAWGQVEVALRGDPPEGDIAFYVLAERLAAVRELVETPWLDHSGFCATNNGYDTCTCGLDAALGFLAEEPVCSHSTYHHGCPSCDRQDPEDR